MANEAVRVEARYVLEDRATKGMKSMEGEAAKLERRFQGSQNMLTRMAQAAMAFGGMSVAGQFTKSIVGANASLETAQTSMAGLLFNSRQMGYTVGPINNMNDALAASVKYYSDLEKHAASAVGTTEDYAKAFAALQLPVLQAGGSMEQLVEMTKLMVPTAQMLGQPMEIASMSVKQALMGMVDARDMLTNQLGFTSETMNKMAKEGKALDAIMGALRRNEPLSKEFGNTFEAKVASVEDTWLRLKRELGRPLFENLKTEMDRLLDWSEKNQEQIKKWAKETGTALKDGFQAVVEASKYIKDHWEGISATIKTLAYVYVADKLVSGFRAAAGWAAAMKASTAFGGAGVGAAGGVAAAAGPWGAAAITLVGLVGGIYQLLQAHKGDGRTPAERQALALEEQYKAASDATAWVHPDIKRASDQRVMDYLVETEGYTYKDLEKAKESLWFKTEAALALEQYVKSAQGLRDIAEWELKGYEKDAGLRQSQALEFKGFVHPQTLLPVQAQTQAGKELTKPPTAVNDFRGSRIEIKLDARHLDPDRVAITVMDALGRAAQRPTGARTAIRGT